MGSIPRVYLREMCFTEIEIDLAVINITVESDNLNATDFTISSNRYRRQSNNCRRLEQQLVLLLKDHCNHHVGGH